MEESMGDRQSEFGVTQEGAGQGGEATRGGEAGSRSRGISDDDIRNRAHEIYQGRGGSEGDPVADWLEAERDLQGRAGGSRTPDDLGAGDDAQDQGEGEARR